MIFHQTDLRAVHLVALERGEPVIKTLIQYALQRNIRCASVSGIGAIGDVEIGAFVVGERRYQRTRLPGDWELLSLSGNLADDDEGKLVFHPHVVLGDADGQTRGGHLFQASCAVTVELVLHEYEWTITRRTDGFTGLKLWS